MTDARPLPQLVVDAVLKDCRQSSATRVMRAIGVQGSTFYRAVQGNPCTPATFEAFCAYVDKRRLDSERVTQPLDGRAVVAVHGHGLDSKLSNRAAELLRSAIDASGGSDD